MYAPHTCPDSSQVWGNVLGMLPLSSLALRVPPALEAPAHRRPMASQGLCPHHVPDQYRCGVTSPMHQVWSYVAHAPGVELCRPCTRCGVMSPMHQVWNPVNAWLEHIGSLVLRALTLALTLTIPNTTPELPLIRSQQEPGSPLRDPSYGPRPKPNLKLKPS